MGRPVRVTARRKGCASAGSRRKRRQIGFAEVATGKGAAGAWLSVGFRGGPASLPNLGVGRMLGGQRRPY
jgi:hypothetical protein